MSEDENRFGDEPISEALSEVQDPLEGKPDKIRAFVLLTTAVSAVAVQAHVMNNPEMFSSPEGVSALVLVGALITAYNAKDIPGFARDVALGAVQMVGDLGQGIAEGVPQGVTRLRGAVRSGLTEVGAGVATQASRVTGHGRESLGRLRELRKEEENLRVETFRDEVIGRYNEMYQRATEQGEINDALLTVCIEEGQKEGFNGDQVEAVLKDRLSRLEKEDVEDRLTRWMRLRRWMTSMTIDPVKRGLSRLDEAVYDQVFGGVKTRVADRIGETERKIASTKKAFLRNRVDGEGSFAKNGHTLEEYDKEAESMAQDIAQMSLAEEVMVRYALSKTGESEESNEALNKRVVAIIEQRRAEAVARAEAERRQAVQRQRQQDRGGSKGRRDDRGRRDQRR